ncbi:ras GTPase-activating protein-binding protein 2-like [Babylonia areolata]|uniref:ras GTPase-activating protein-binding protein 2-like n=1 Tax=Babylonia areolata TaxID=304850 RepID=UPI003FD30FF9
MVKTTIEESTMVVKTDQDQEETEYNPVDANQVGKEFVAHYYTIMDEGPHFLYLFYTQKSTFVHGGIERFGREDPVYTGQAEIRTGIASLNFQDCRPKLHQVDSQESINGSILVQTAGELCEEGSMRRFMQSFVLVRNGPKTFYVRNCIFRYQDEEFSDEEDLSEEPPVPQEGSESISSEGDQTAHAETKAEAPAAPETAPVAAEESPDTSEAQSSPVSETAEHVGEVEEEIAPAEGNEKVEEKTTTPARENVEEEKQSAEPSGMPEETSPESAEPQEESPKTFSWAALVSKRAPATTSTEAALAGAITPVVRKSDKTERKPAPVAAAAATAAPSTKQVEAPRPQRPQRENNRARERSNSKGEGRNGENGTKSFNSGPKYPDDQQLFVGNLPHSMTEPELKSFFECYGTVLDLRINTKGSGSRVPNFGFVVFESSETAQTVLKQKPIMYKGEHRLNVEEKKTRGDHRPAARGNARYGPGPRNYGSRGGYRGGGNGRHYSGERHNGGRDFHRGDGPAPARQ